MNKICLIIALVFCAMIIPSNDVFACKCVIPASTSEKLDFHSVVFLGKVVKIDKVFFSQNYKVEFEVEKSWKGVFQSKIKVYTAIDSATCGYNFEKNKKYIVYAQSYEDGTIHTGSCSGNIDSNDIVEEEEQLGETTIILNEKQDIMIDPYLGSLIITCILILFSLAYFFLIHKRNS